MKDLLSQAEEKQILAKAKYYAMEFVEANRPPLHLRDKVDLGFSLNKRELIIFEWRIIPMPRGGTQPINSDIAKAKFIKSRGIWKIFWKRANGNWQAYDPEGSSEIEEITDFFKILEEDKYGAFWG